LHHKKQAALYLTIAVVCAFVGFVAIFKGGMNLLVALGLCILMFTGFFYFLAKTFDAWDAKTGKDGNGKAE